MGHNQTPLEYDLNCTGHVWNTMSIQQRSCYEERKKTHKKNSQCTGIYWINANDKVFSYAFLYRSIRR